LLHCLATGRHYRRSKLSVKDDRKEIYKVPERSLISGQARRR
jgi:hypothetical protein